MSGAGCCRQFCLPAPFVRTFASALSVRTLRPHLTVRTLRPHLRLRRSDNFVALPGRTDICVANLACQDRRIDEFSARKRAVRPESVLRSLALALPITPSPMDGCTRRVSVAAGDGESPVPVHAPLRLLPAAFTAVVVLACLAWSTPAAASIQAIRREPPRVGAARRAPATHPLTSAHVDFNFGRRLDAVVSGTRDGGRRVASAARRDCRHPAVAPDPEIGAPQSPDASARDVGLIPSHWGATHLSI